MRCMPATPHAPRAAPQPARSLASRLPSTTSTLHNPAFQYEYEFEEANEEEVLGGTLDELGGTLDELDGTRAAGRCDAAAASSRFLAGIMTCPGATTPTSHLSLQGSVERDSVQHHASAAPHPFPALAAQPRVRIRDDAQHQRLAPRETTEARLERIVAAQVRAALAAAAPRRQVRRPLLATTHAGMAVAHALLAALS